MINLKEIASSKLFQVIIVILTFFAIRELKIIYYESQVISELSEKYDSIVLNTKDGEYASDNAKKEFDKINKYELDKLSGFEKTNEAADKFFGAYTINVRSNYDFCLEHGVDITKFITEYKNVNSSFYRDYIKIKKQFYINSRMLFSEDALKKEDDDLYNSLKDLSKKAITQTMIDRSKKWNTNGDMKLTCNLLNDNYEEFSKSWSLDKVVPYVIQTMVDGASKLE